MTESYVREFEFKINSNNCFVRTTDANEKIDFYVEASLKFDAYYDDEDINDRRYNWVSSYVLQSKPSHTKVFDYKLVKPCRAFRLRIESVCGTDLSGLVAILNC